MLLKLQVEIFSKVLLKMSLVASCLALLACSQQWRESSPPMTDTEVMQSLDSVSTSAISLGNSSFSTNWIQSADAEVFVASGPGVMGPAKSIIAFPDLSVLASELSGYSDLDLQEAKVFFIDGRDPNTGERRFFLNFQLNVANLGTTTNITIPDSGFAFSKNKFDISFQTNSTQMHLISYDVSNGQFNEVIQLQAFDNQGTYIGKFPTLVGYTY